jgi:hypothetical protein
MKLSHILPLVVGSVAAGVLASTSPSHALTWNLNNVTFADGGTATGSFDYDTATNTYSNINITVTGPLLGGGSFTFQDSNYWKEYDPSYIGSAFELPLVENLEEGSAGVWLYNLVNGWGTASASNPGLTMQTKYGLVMGDFSQMVAGTASSSSAAVPFDIPGGATIPSVGALLALGAMRKARKNIASKTRLANPV